MHRALTPWRIKWYARGALLAVALAFLGTVVTTNSDNITFAGERLGTDFPAFYGAGKIIAEGRGNQLYDISVQRESQAAVSGNGEVVLFPYPPFFALAYVPLSRLPYRLAYTIHALALVTALALSCMLLRRLYPGLISDPVLLFAIVLTAHPVLRSIAAAQNTTLSILLIVSCWYAAQNQRQFLAGVFLGLLFFKPQFAAPLTGLFLLSGRWRVSASAVVTAGALCAIAVWVAGPEWFGDWLAFAAGMFKHHMLSNVPFIVSWMSIAEATFGDILVFGWGATLVMIAALSWAWFAGGRGADIDAQIGLASVCILMIAPITLYYDTGITIIAMIAIMAQRGRLNPALIAFVWLASYLQLAHSASGIFPSFLALFAVLFLAVAYLWAPAARRPAIRTQG